MERAYNHEMGKHELRLSTAELELMYRALAALEGVVLVQSSLGNTTTVSTDLLREMTQFTSREGY